MFTLVAFGCLAIRTLRLPFALLAAACVLFAVAWLRGGEYDEFYSIFLITGHPRPQWPTTPFAVGSARFFYHGCAGLGQIADDLRRYDVHPPLYFWLLDLWHRVVGSGLLRLRLLSVLLTVATLGVLARIAQRVGVPGSLAVFLTLLCYGFAHTGIVTRDFALTDLLSLTGVLLLIEAGRAPGRLPALCGGIALGAACFSNYLASFMTIAMLLWFTAINWRSPKSWLAACAGAGIFVPGGLWFLQTQAGSRTGQFVPFNPLHAVAALARDQAGAIFGALPLYAPAPWSGGIALCLMILIVVLAVCVFRHGLPVLRLRYRALVVAGVMAPPLGLLVLGTVFDNTPIEIRYLWLGLPYIGLALAAALRNRPKLAALVMAVQSAAILGLALAPRTMQPGARVAAAAAGIAGPSTLVIVPFGNDGVGIPGPFIAAAPATMMILVARRADVGILNRAAAYREVAIARIMVDGTSRRLVPALADLFNAASCWHSAAAAHGLAVYTNQCRRTP